MSHQRHAISVTPHVPCAQPEEVWVDLCRTLPSLQWNVLGIPSAQRRSWILNHARLLGPKASKVHRWWSPTYGLHGLGPFHTSNRSYTSYTLLRYLDPGPRLSHLLLSLASDLLPPPTYHGDRGWLRGSIGSAARLAELYPLSTTPCPYSVQRLDAPRGPGGASGGGVRWDLHKPWGRGDTMPEIADCPT